MDSIQNTTIDHLFLMNMIISSQTKPNQTVMAKGTPSEYCPSTRIVWIIEIGG